MRDVERLITRCCAPTPRVRSAERLTYREAMQLHAGVDAFRLQARGVVRRAAPARGVAMPRDLELTDRDACLDLIMSTVVGPQLGRGGSLSSTTTRRRRLRWRACKRRPTSLQRFEIYLDGIELANGFHELGRRRRAARAGSSTISPSAARAACRRCRSMRACWQRWCTACPSAPAWRSGFDRVVMCAAGARQHRRSARVSLRHGPESARLMEHATHQTIDFARQEPWL